MPIVPLVSVQKAGQVPGADCATKRHSKYEGIDTQTPLPSARMEERMPERPLVPRGLEAWMRRNVPDCPKGSLSPSGSEKGQPLKSPPPVLWAA
jgi:hypothetical protein